MSGLLLVYLPPFRERHEAAELCRREVEGSGLGRVLYDLRGRLGRVDGTLGSLRLLIED